MAREDEECVNYSVATFDPGGTTGWAVFVIQPEAMWQPELKILEHVVHWDCGQFYGSEGAMVDEMFDLCEVWPTADIVCEDFILRQYRQDRELLLPVRINAKLEDRLYVATKKSGDIRKPHYQQPSMAKSAMSDPRLKEAGYLEATAGTPHARDGVRHALTWIRRRKQSNISGRPIKDSTY